MDFWIKYGIYIAFGIAAVISIITIIIGFVAMNKDKGLSKKKVFKAKVLSCIIGGNYYPGTRYQGFDIILDIETPKGNIRKEITRRDPMDIGTTVEVNYDSKKDIIRFTDEAFDEEKKYPIVLIAFGIYFLLNTIISYVGLYTNNGKALIGLIGGTTIACIFIFLGAWISIIRPHKMNKNMVHCEKVEGRIADVVRQGKIGGNFDHGHHHHSQSYSYLYEYEYGGVKRTIKSKTASNTHTHAAIGRKVEIVINHKTGDVFCMDDEKTGVGLGIVLLIFGVLAIPAVLFICGIF